MNKPKKSLGSRMYYVGEYPTNYTIVTQVSVYDGDTEDSIFNRARTCLELLSERTNQYLGKYKFYPVGK